MTVASKPPRLAFRLPVPAGFAFASTVTSHGWYRLAPFGWSEDRQILTRIEVAGGRVCELRIACDSASLLVEGAKDSAGLRTKLARMFQLGVAIDGFAQLASRSPRHAWVVPAGFGRLLCGATLFEDVVKIIATTNTTWQQTIRMVGLLTQKCGLRLGDRAAFPRPSDIVRFSADELQRDCRLGYRAAFIHALASGIVDGTIDLVRIADPAQSTPGLLSAYRTLPGIGPYGAAHLLAMDGRHDFIAVDSEFRKFVRETYHRGRAVSDATMLRRYAKWGRWKYLAYWSELWSAR